MKFDEFFRAFHIGENDSALMSHTTTWAIPKFFAETVLKTKNTEINYHRISLVMTSGTRAIHHQEIIGLIWRLILKRVLLWKH